MAFYVYMLRCADGSFYVGHTEDLEMRLGQHRGRRFSGYTAKRLPVQLVFADAFATRDEAFAAERQIKGWSRAKKQALVQQDWEMLSRRAMRHKKPNASRESSAYARSVWPPPMDSSSSP